MYCLSEADVNDVMFATKNIVKSLPTLNIVKSLPTQEQEHSQVPAKKKT